jgi:hypothetical protein
MNESTLTQLKIIVERVVRPVYGSTACKRKMREELLAHVTAVFDEETKRGDEGVALQRTAERLGAPAELTAQLQGTVSASDRMSAAIEALLGFPPHGSKWRLALRHALLVAAMITPLLVLMIGIMTAVSVPWSEWLTVYRLPALLTPVFCAVLTFGASLLVQSMIDALFGPQGRSWPRVIGLSAAAWLLVPAVSLLWCVGMNGDVAASSRDVLSLLLPGALAPVVLVLVGGLSIGEIRHCEEWAALKLD